MASGFHLGTFLIFVAFMLLLIVSLSAPIADQVAFLKVQLASEPSLTIAFGNWGYCILQPGGNECSGRSVGYDMMRILEQLDGVNPSNAANTVHSVSRALILHPIACGIAFFSFLAALAGDSIGFALSSLIAVLAMIFTLITTVIDWVNFGRVHHHVNSSDGPGYGAHFSSAIWLVTASFIILFFGSLTACCGFMTDRRLSGSRY